MGSIPAGFVGRIETHCDWTERDATHGKHTRVAAGLTRRAGKLINYRFMMSY